MLSILNIKQISTLVVQKNTFNLLAANAIQTILIFLPLLHGWGEIADLKALRLSGASAFKTQ